MKRLERCSTLSVSCVTSFLSEATHASRDASAEGDKDDWYLARHDRLAIRRDRNNDMFLWYVSAFEEGAAPDDSQPNGKQDLTHRRQHPRENEFGSRDRCSGVVRKRLRGKDVIAKMIIRWRR